MNELKPCPFCGGRAEIIRLPAIYVAPIFFITCVDCGVETPRVAKTIEQAIEAWNRRTTDER